MLLEFELRVVIALLLGLAATLSAGCARDNDAASQGNEVAAAPSSNAVTPVTGRLDRSHAGTPAPTFTFQDENGQATSMAAFRGKPTLVNLWATWCAPCIVEMPSLDALAGREGDALNIVALSQDLDGRDQVTRFFGERNFRHLEANLDPDMRFMTEMRLDTLPTTILYDAEGREVWRMVGMAEWQSDRIARLLDEAEAG